MARGDFFVRRSIRLLVLLAATASAATAVSGCRLGRAVGRAGGSFFDSPRSVKTLEHPVDRFARLAVIWVGHATALVQIDDKVILTDPVFATTVGQLSKRVYEPGIKPENLPPLDAVLISHMHFDHLSLGSLDTIQSKVRMLVMPTGGVTYLTDFSFPVIELRRWQAWEEDGLRITAAPVDHVGFRYGVDDAWMTESFTGYVIEYHGVKVYFGGDSAYDTRVFAETAERFPGIDLALLPIAPIEPRALMRRFHMDPREAVQAFFDLGAKRMVPIHYDTFVGSTDDPGDALRELSVASRRWDLTHGEVAPLAIGERRVFLRVGEDPVSQKAKAAGGWGTGSKTTPLAPSKHEPAKPAPAPTSTIPDDERLDWEVRLRAVARHWQ